MEEELDPIKEEKEKQIHLEMARLMKKLVVAIEQDRPEEKLALWQQLVDLQALVSDDEESARVLAKADQALAHLKSLKKG